MKKLSLLLLSLILCFSLKAQDKNYTETIDSLFINLNKTEITTGILYDRVFPFAGLDIFNVGVADTSSFGHFNQAYLELFNASYNNSTMTTPKDLIEFSKAQLFNGNVPIGLLNYNYNLMDTLAEDNNLVSVTGLMLYDVAGRPQSPYLLKNVTVAAAMADTVYSSNVNFQLFSNTYLQNTSLTIGSLQVDFGDGTGLQSVTANQPKAISYSSGGLKTLKYVVTYSNAQTVTTYSTLYVFYTGGSTLRAGGLIANTATCNGIGDPQTLNIEADISYQGYEESVGFKGQATATIFYHDSDCDRVIKKPIIITDGFDPGSKRFTNDIYRLLVYKNDLTDSSNLALELIHAGYDVIIFDYPQYPKNGKMIDGGSDYIQRNAYSLIKLINTINGMKASNADSLIIVGPSMGGLISRYALTYMEHHNMPHKTKLWVSFDAPHLGANIPIGDQWMLKYLGVNFGNADARKKLEEKINTPAAKEMILHHYLSGQQTPTPYYTRNLFMQELENLGFPVGDPGKTIRNIALVNGSGVGTRKNNFAQLALQFSEQPTTGFRIVAGVATLLSPKRLIFKIFKIVGKALGIIQAGTTGIIDTKVWFTPGYNGSNKVFRGTMFSGLIMKREYFAGTPNNSIGLDNAPGGLFDTQKQIKDGLDQALDKGFARLLYKPVYNAYVPDHGFIPIKSSLAVTSVTNFGENFSSRSLVCTGETPFNSYFTPDENQEHIFLTKQSVDYITKEINGEHQLPLIKNTTLNISGPVQSGSSTTYSVANIPTGATIKWEVTSPYAINGSNTANPVGIVIPSNNNRFVELIATISTSCYKTIARRTLVPPQITTTLENGGACGSSLAEINVPSGANFTWSATGDITIAGLPQGTSYATTNNTVHVAGTQGTLTVSFQSYGNTVNTYYNYEPYLRSISVAANPMIGSDPLSASVQGLDFSYNSIKWYIDGQLLNSEGESIYESENPSCGNHALTAEAVLPCGETVRVGETEIERICGGWRLAVFPNPASEKVIIEYTNDASNKETGKTSAKTQDKTSLLFEVKIYNDKGKFMRSVKNKTSENAIEITTGDLPNGSYFLHVLRGKEAIKKQIIISH